MGRSGGHSASPESASNLKKWVIFAISSDLGVSSRNLSLLILCGGLQRVKGASQGLRGTPGARILKKGAMVHKGGLRQWATLRWPDGQKLLLLVCWGESSLGCREA